MLFGPALFPLRPNCCQSHCAAVVRARLWPNDTLPDPQVLAAQAEPPALSGQPLSSDGKRAATPPVYFHSRVGNFRHVARHGSGRHIGPTASLTIVADTLDSGPGLVCRTKDAPLPGSRAMQSCGVNLGEPPATRRSCARKAFPARSIQRIVESLETHEKRNAGQCLSTGGMPDRHC
jgi:hypothetical protein